MKMKEKDIKYLNGKSIEVYFGPIDSEEEYGSLDYCFEDGKVYYGIGFVSDNLNDIEIYNFSKDNDLKKVFAELKNDDHRFVLNIVLNLILHQIEEHDFYDILDAVDNDRPFYCIIFKDEDFNPIVEDLEPHMSFGYFRGII